MTDRVNYDASCGYVLTRPMSEQLQGADCCQCDWLLVIDGAVSCTACGTVYGVVYGFNRWYTRRRWRRATAS